MSCEAWRSERENICFLQKRKIFWGKSSRMLSVWPLISTLSIFPTLIGKNSASACHLIRLEGLPPASQMITADPTKASLQTRHRGVWQRWWKEGSINWKAKHSEARREIFLVHGACRVSRVYGGISDSTNDMESPPVALEPPRAARCVAANTGGTAWRLPQEQTCRLRAAVPRIVIFKYSHI